MDNILMKTVFLHLGSSSGSASAALKHKNPSFQASLHLNHQRLIRKVSSNSLSNFNKYILKFVQKQFGIH